MRVTLCTVLLSALFLSSCAPMANENARPAGAAAGALGGAILGGIAGKQSGNASQGALVGGLGGGVLGYQNGDKWFGGDGSIEKVRMGNGGN